MNGRMKTSRRGFLKQTVAATVAMGGASALWMPHAANAAPVKGGHLRVGMAQGATSDILDPGNLSGSVTRSVTFAAFNNLTEIASDGSLIGELAESWDVSDDATIWTFNLRKGVQFQDGQDFLADDVAATLHYHIREDSTSGQKKLISEISEMKVLDPHTIEISLATANVDFAAILAGPGFYIKKATGNWGILPGI